MMIAHIPNPDGLLSIETVADANPGWKVEREADGSFTMSPTGIRSGAHNVALILLLAEWQKRAGGQLLESSTGFTMPDKSLRSPDASWISSDRWSALSEAEKDGYGRIVPDVCIEVASRTDSVDYLIAKLQRFRRFGATYVLLIDPWTRKTWSDGVMPFGFPTDFTSVFDAGNT